MIRFTIGQDLYSQIVKFSIILILFYLSSFILNAAGQSAMSIISAKISRNLRTQIIGKITRLPLKYYDSNTIGNTLSKITNDVGTLSDNLSQAVTALTSGIFMLVGLLVAMFSVS
jgi:ATP-binding cassette subfamily B protein